jgi:hypothetical protein
MTATEESTLVDSTMMRLAGDGNDNVCLDTVATTIAAAEEIRLVCFVAGTEFAGKDGTGDGVDTVATQDAAGETVTLHCSERTENSAAVSNPINLIPIGLDTAATSTAAGETGIGGYAGAAENFSAADNTREHEHSAENSAELPAVAGHDIQIASCKETTHAWDKRLSKFDMTIFANERNKLRVFPLGSARMKSKRDGRGRRPRSASRDGSTVLSSDNDPSGPAAPVPLVSSQQSASMSGHHAPLQTRQSAQGNSSSDQVPGGHPDASDDGGSNNTEPGDGGGWGSSSGPSAFRQSSGESYCATHEIHESRVRELRSQLDEAETLVQSLRSDSASERLKGKQIINDMEAELEQCLRDRETDKQVSTRALKNSDRSRTVEIEEWLMCEQALTDENILLKNANEHLRIELNGTIRQREHEEESLRQGQARELVLTEENSKLTLEISELKRDNRALISK